MSKVIVEVNKLSMHFKNIDILKGIDLQIEENKIYGLLGKNGVGKTTLINSLVGHFPKFQGDIKLFGEDPYKVPKVLDDVCVVREQMNFPMDYKGKHILEHYHMFYPNYDKELEQELIAFFEIPIKSRISKYSRGMQTLLMNIVGLCCRAKLVIYDEPTLGLDAVNRLHFYEILLEQYAKYPQTIMMSTHQIEEVESLLEEVIILDGGKVIIQESLEGLKERSWQIVGEKEKLEQLELLKGKKGRQQLGKLWSYIYYGELNEEDFKVLDKAGAQITSIDLQRLFVEMIKGRAFQDGSNEKVY